MKDARDEEDLALTIAAAVSLASATLAKEHCPVGQVYFRSKHTCVGKRTAIARKIYHYPRHVAAQADEATIVHHRLRRARAATSARSIPLPPVRLVGAGRVSAPAQNETVDSSGSVLPPTPGIQLTSPYGRIGTGVPCRIRPARLAIGYGIAEANIFDSQVFFDSVA